MFTMQDLLFRVACHGGGDEPLSVHLRRITDSAYTRKTLGGTDIEGQLVAPIIAESHDEDCRREIMRFLHECLSEAGNGKRWQKIYGGLALAENLMQHASSALLEEVAQGRHFDLVQKVSFLEHFDAVARGCSDRRAQHVVRKKASELRTTLASLLEKANAEALKIQSPECKDTASISSGSTATPSTASSSTRSSPSSACSVPRSPGRDGHIDDAFDALREWMESVHSNSASATSSPTASPSVSITSSPKSCPGDSELSIDDSDSDWERLEHLPPSYSALATTQGFPSDLLDWFPASCASDGSDTQDVFFTPMPAPAFPLPAQPTFNAVLFSL